MGILSSIYLTGRDNIKADHEKAFSLASLSAEYGDCQGQLSLAMCYSLGLGTKLNKSNAAMWAYICKNFKFSSKFDNTPFKKAAKQILEDIKEHNIKQYNEGIKNAKEWLKVRNISWEKITIPNLCSIDIPSNMEIQNGVYKNHSTTGIKTLLNLDKLPDNRIVLQPKGINKFKKSGLKYYSRFIIAPVKMSKEEYELLDNANLSQSDLTDFNDIVKAGITKNFKKVKKFGSNMEIIEWNDVSKTKFNNLNAITWSFTRQLNSEVPVIVTTYLIFKNKKCYKITESFRNTEVFIWSSNFLKMQSSITFI
jgi:hypothetical protein